MNLMALIVFSNLVILTILIILKVEALLLAHNACQKQARLPKHHASSCPVGFIRLMRAVGHQ